MQPNLDEFSIFQYRNDALEAKIDAAKGWVNVRNRNARRKAFQIMADLIAQRSPEYIRELESQKFGYFL